MATIFSIKFCHEGFVGVSDHEDAGVKGVNLLFAALMRLNADGPSTPPMVPLPFKSCETMTSHSEYIYILNSQWCIIMSVLC